MTIKKTTTITIEASEEQLEIIRSLLCRESLKALGQAHESQQEAEEKGIQDNFSHIHYEYRSKIKEMIKAIDKASKAE